VLQTKRAICIIVLGVHVVVGNNSHDTRECIIYKKISDCVRKNAVLHNASVARPASDAVAFRALAIFGTTPKPLKDTPTLPGRSSRKSNALLERERREKNFTIILSASGIVLSHLSRHVESNYIIFFNLSSLTSRYLFMDYILFEKPKVSLHAPFLLFEQIKLSPLDHFIHC
jgi:general stress protein CsbA